MDWSDERYVRLYTRDTTDWSMWPWQSRAVFPLLLRKADRCGVVELGRYGVRGLVALLGLPLDVVEPGVAGLLEDGCIEQGEGRIVLRNFVEAQESQASEVKRSREYRQRRRSEAATRHEASRTVTQSDGVDEVRDESSQNVTQASQNVTNRHEESRGITEHHEASRTVTPSLAVPSLAITDLSPSDSCRLTPTDAVDEPSVMPDNATTGALKAKPKPLHQLAQLWNENAPPECPRVREVTGKRRKHADARWSEKPDREYWLAVLAKVRESAFLRGEKGDWIANFDWFVKPGAATKVLEGSFSDRARAPPKQKFISTLHLSEASKLAHKQPGAILERI